MLRRVQEYRVDLYKIESNNYQRMIDDLNDVIEELESIGDDGVFPITLSRTYENGDTYIEIHTDLIFVLRKGGLLGFLEYPRGLSVEMDDRYNVLGMKDRMPYMLSNISEGKVVYMGRACTMYGNLLDTYALNNQIYIDKMEEWMEYYSQEISIKHDIYLLKGAADMKEHLLEYKYNEIVLMKERGFGLENLAENPYEDMFYSHEDSVEPYIDRSIPEKLHK